MPERIIFPEFRDELESTKYPFGDTATLKSSDGELVIERDTFLDATLFPILGKGPLYISSITVATHEVRLVIGDTINLEVASASFDPLDPPDSLYLTDAWGRPAGLLVSDVIRLSRFGAWESRVYNFQLADAEFAASCVIPTPEPGVRGVLSANTELFTGDLWIVGDNGVVVRAEGDDIIRVDIVGDPLFVRKLCEQVERFEPPLFIKTINNCPPDAYGNFHLVVGDTLAAETIVRIYPTGANTLRIEAVGQTVKDKQQG